MSFEAYCGVLGGNGCEDYQRLHLLWSVLFLVGIGLMVTSILLPVICRIQKRQFTKKLALVSFALVVTAAGLIGYVAYERSQEAMRIDASTQCIYC